MINEKFKMMEVMVHVVCNIYQIDITFSDLSNRAFTTYKFFIAFSYLYAAGGGREL